MWVAGGFAHRLQRGQHAVAKGRGPMPSAGKGQPNEQRVVQQAVFRDIDDRRVLALIQGRVDGGIVGGTARQKSEGEGKERGIFQVATRINH